MNKILRDWKFQETKLDKVWRQKIVEKLENSRKKYFCLKISEKAWKEFYKARRKIYPYRESERDLKNQNFLITNNGFWKFSFSKKWKFIDRSESPTNSPTKNFQKSTEKPLVG